MVGGGKEKVGKSPDKEIVSSVRRSLFQHYFKQIEKYLSSKERCNI